MSTPAGQVSVTDTDVPAAHYDAVVIGGGFFGCAIAVYLAKSRGLSRIFLVEREAALMQRASYNNQARAHGGYHYPRSFTTAFRSRINLPRFVQSWPDAIKSDFIKLYAIARRNSKVTARQFERFSGQIGARLRPAPEKLRHLFDDYFVENAYLVDEYGFDTRVLAEWASGELRENGVEVRLRSRVTGCRKARDGIAVTWREADAAEHTCIARRVFNCAYSGINQIQGDFAGVSAGIKQEITEMALVEVPPELASLGITVMDGPFFSLMPFPAAGVHSLSHVRYTPHTSWHDRQGVDPYGRLEDWSKNSMAERMLRDAARYVPSVRAARQVGSIFEVKTVLVRNEGDDGRPILFEASADMPGFYSILGGKIDNVFDVIERLDSEDIAGA
ncbi:MAG: FAD-dependent oxidoreductase [Pseudomonadota bacterium]